MNVRSALAALASLVMCTAAATADPCSPVIDLTLGTPGAPDSGIGKLFPTDFFSPGTRYMAVGGGFSQVGGIANTSGIAVWNGAVFSPVGSGIDFGTSTAEVNAFAVFGGKLYIGGQFDGAIGGPGSRGIIRWTGAAYESVNNGIAVSPAMALRALTVFKGELYVAGTFIGIGSQATNMIAKLNATGDDFLPLAFSTASTAAGAFDMVTFDDGSGEKLYVCGNFTSVQNDDGTGSAVTVPDTRWIARWTGTQWESVGGGITSGSPSNFPRDLLVFDDGTGPALYVGGGRSFAAGSAVQSAVHRWDGVSWKGFEGFHDDPLDTASTANSLGLYNDGCGTSILAQVRLSQSGGANARQVLMKLDGGRFEPVPGVLLDSSASEIVQSDVGGASRTWLGGFFTVVNGLSANRLAQLSGCQQFCPADFNEDGTVSIDDLFLYINAYFVGCP